MFSLSYKEYKLEAEKAASDGKRELDALLKIEMKILYFILG